ncbi:hypothetical protein HMPREF1991_02041 [Hoylesella loescheii DSM 19665 = JCM 12249 = ATCC 15930]|uniref:Uncharacterized protein n=1 Tax=Hoylesella loescheii DSM 19665 = JCM 12249 = ATCC 15930 TaxID=1122985 RepID=A0A069QG95_HOYLO|nr:hypothetical protein HMPREF1991_02041 [Hoylesella loescheii DSM 19665 = JCM 12249 = ATCC 15930]
MPILPAPIHWLSWIVCYPKQMNIKVNVAGVHIHKSLQRLPFIVSPSSFLAPTYLLP